MERKFFLFLFLIFVIGCSNESVTNEVFFLGSESVEKIVISNDINVIAKQWEFEPSIIEVNRGNVKLSIESVDVSHGISIPDFGVSEFLVPGKTTNIEFVADKTGEFTFFCNVQCGHGHGEMRGKLVVN
jgi:cytochrome c oxidase subunit II